MDLSVEDPLHISMEGDDGPIWDQAPEFSVEPRLSDCVDVNLFDKDPVHEGPEGIYESGVLIDCVRGLAGQIEVYVFGEELDGKLVIQGPNKLKIPAQVS